MDAPVYLSGGPVAAATDPALISGCPFELTPTPNMVKITSFGPTYHISEHHLTLREHTQGDWPLEQTRPVINQTANAIISIGGGGSDSLVGINNSRQFDSVTLQLVTWKYGGCGWGGLGHI